jgi:hypothetical protein
MWGFREVFGGLSTRKPKFIGMANASPSLHLPLHQLGCSSWCQTEAEIFEPFLSVLRQPAVGCVRADEFAGETWVISGFGRPWASVVCLAPWIQFAATHSRHFFWLAAPSWRYTASGRMAVVNTPTQVTGKLIFRRTTWAPFLTCWTIQAGLTTIDGLLDRTPRL